MFWKIVLLIAIGYGCFFAGNWGFAQIVGSIQYAKERGAALTIGTISLHVVLLSVIAFLVLHFLYPYRYALYIGYVISLVVILCSGKMK